MPASRKKFELSPRLKLGVGRSQHNKIFKITAVLCLLLAFGAAGYAFHLIISDNGGAGQSAPQVLGASDVKTSGSSPQMIEYKITAGDTLFNISQKYNISWTVLATLNNLKSPFILQPGQTLEIPQ